MGIGKVYRFLILHLLWLAFTLLGLVFFGFFPATYALFETLKEPTDLTGKEYTKYFIKVYRASFVKMNQAAIIWQVMFVLMGLNLFIFNGSNAMIQFGIIGLLLLMVLCIVYFLQYFTIEMKVMEQIKRSFGYVFLYPKKNIIFMTIIFGLILVINFSPGISLFFGSSVAAHFIVKTCAM